MSKQLVDLGGLAFSMPAGWQVMSLIAAAPPPEESDQPTFRANMVMALRDVKEGTKVRSMTNSLLTELQGAGAEVKAKNIETITLPHGQEALLIELAMPSPAGQGKVRQMQLVAVDGTTLYNATVSEADGPAFEGARAGFRDLLTNFRLGKKK